MPNFSVSLPVDVLLKADNNQEIQDLLDIPSESLVNYISSASVSLSSQVEALTSDLNALITVTDAHENSININSGNISALSASVFQLSGQSTLTVGLSTNVTVLSTNVNILSTNVNVLFSNVNTLSSNVNTLSANLDILESETLSISDFAGLSSGFADLSLSNVDPISARNSINAESSDIVFYDIFEDYIRYPDNSRLTHLSSFPLYGNAWRLNENVPQSLSYIWGGSFRAGLSGLVYLGSSVQTQNNGKFSMGFEFTPRTSYIPDSTIKFSCNATYNSQEMLPATGGISPTGSVHCNWGLDGIQQLNIFNSTVGCTALPASNVILISSINNDFQTGDPIAFYGTTTGLGISASSPGSIYYAISNTAGSIKIADTYLNALSGIALTLGGSTNLAFAVEHTPVCINRQLYLNTYPWTEPTFETREIRTLSASTDDIELYFPATWATGTKVKIEGSNSLSGAGPFVFGNDYYIIRPGAFARTIRLADSRANALAGIPVDITSSSLHTRGTLGIYGYTQYNAASPSVSPDNRYVLLVEADGDIVSYTLVGVGTVKFFSRKLREKVGPTTYFWWEPGGPRLTPNGVQAIADLHAAWAESPKIQDRYVGKYSGGAIKKLANVSPVAYTSRLDLLYRGNRVGADALPNQGLGLQMVVGGVSGTHTTTGALRIDGGHIYTEGGYLANVGSASTGGSLLGRANMTVGTTSLAPVSSLSASQITTLKAIGTAPAFSPGDIEKYTFYISLVGTNAKSLGIYAPIYAYNIFNYTLSPTVTGMGKIHMDRICQTNATHVYCTQMVLPDGTITPSRKFAINNDGVSQFGLVLSAASVDNGGVVLEWIDREIKRTAVT